MPTLGTSEVSPTTQLVRVASDSVEDLGQLIKVPAYLAQNQRHLLSSGVVVFGASGIARSLICPRMAKACEHASYDYGVRVISTRSSDIVDALNGQDRLFVEVTTSAQENRAKLNGVITEALFAPRDPALVLDRLVDEETRYVFLTITRAGYNLRSEVTLEESDFLNRPAKDWLDFSKPEIAHDVMHSEEPTSPLGFIVEALRLRKEAGVKPFVVISCENMPQSGRVAKNVIIAFAQEVERQMQDNQGLAKWIDGNVDFIDAVVDRITPAGRLEQSQEWLSEKGVFAAHPVTCEPDWRLILSNNWREGIPAGWAEAGVEFMSHSELEAWRLVKQALLNGGHAVLGFTGKMLGFDFVHEAVGDSQLRDLLTDLMSELEPSLIKPPGFDLTNYRMETFRRFGNTALPDELSRVGRQRSYKMQQYLMHPVVKLMALGSSMESISKILALWVFSMSKEGESLVRALPENAEQSVFDLCESMMDAAKDGSEHLFASVVRSQEFFPEGLRLADDDFVTGLYGKVRLLAAMVEEEGVDNGLRLFLRPLN